MKILQLRKSEISYLKDKRFLIVESQNLGQESDFRYHVAVSDSLAKQLEKNNFVRIIKDTGRTIGFWQNLGGSGIFRPDAVSAITTPDIPDRVVTRIKTMSPAKIKFTGKTWREIILSMPFTSSALKGIGIVKTKATVASKKKK